MPERIESYRVHREGPDERTPVHELEPCVLCVRTNEQRQPVQAYVRCPCGKCGFGNEGALLSVTLEPGTPGGWQLSGSDEAPTISPSVAVRGCCNSHFFIRDGQVVWA